MFVSLSIILFCFSGKFLWQNFGFCYFIPFISQETFVGFAEYTYTQPLLYNCQKMFFMKKLYLKTSKRGIAVSCSPGVPWFGGVKMGIWWRASWAMHGMVHGWVVVMLFGLVRLDLSLGGGLVGDGEGVIGAVWYFLAESDNDEKLYVCIRWLKSISS